MTNVNPNRRVRYTRMMLRQSLLELMDTRPINKITVKDICARADINRGTFYAHYADPYDLLSHVEQELYQAIRRSIEKTSSAQRLSTLLCDIFAAIAEHSDLCRILFSEFGDKAFSRRVVYMAHDKSLEEWRALVKDTPAWWLEAAYAFNAYGIAGAIEHWVKTGMQASPQELAALVEMLSNRGLQAFLKDVTASSNVAESTADCGGSGSSEIPEMVNQRTDESGIVLDAVEAFLAGYSPQVRSLVLQARALALDIIPDAVEQVDLPGKLLGYGRAATYAGTICVIMPLKAAVNLGFARGVDLPDPEGLLVGTGKRARHVRLTTPADVDRPALRALIEAAAAAGQR